MHSWVNESRLYICFVVHQDNRQNNQFSFPKATPTLNLCLQVSSADKMLLTFCLLLLPLWESVIVLCFVVRYFMSILVLQSSWWGRERWLLCLLCLPGVLWWLSGSSSRCHGVVCSLWLWYFLIILTISDLDPNCLTLWWYSWKNFSKKINSKRISRR